MPGGSLYSPMDSAQVTPRTLRCANGALYMLMALGVVAAAAYAVICGRVEGAVQLGLALGGCVLALLWGGYYAALRYRVSPEGVTRCLLGQRVQPWAALRRGDIYRKDERGVAVCRITLEFEGCCWCISSELFDQDAVQELAAELTAAGLPARGE